jgi:hypothetical protein
MFSSRRGWRRLCIWASLSAAVLLGDFAARARAVDIPGATAKYVIHISVDALNVDALNSGINNGLLPNLAALRANSAWTDNARSDYTFTVTSPNHACIFTGRPVCTWGDKLGHLWGDNCDRPWQRYHKTFHKNYAGKTGEADAYISSVFDVAEDAGLRTGLFAGKYRFDEELNSWDVDAGSVAALTRKNAKDYSSNLVQDWEGYMKGADPLQYSFIHFADTDIAGHAWTWSTKLTSKYMSALKRVDDQLGEIVSFVSDAGSDFYNNTTIVLTADHGGLLGTKGHDDATRLGDYRVPLYVWGNGATKGADLYGLNTEHYKDPGIGRPTYNEEWQPIRNGDTGNLCMSLLGLDPIPLASMDTIDESGYYALRVGDDPLQAQSFRQSTSLPSLQMQGLSGMTTIIPEPGAVAIVLSGALCWCLAGLARRWRRR